MSPFGSKHNVNAYSCMFWYVFVTNLWGSDLHLNSIFLQRGQKRGQNEASLARPKRRTQNARSGTRVPNAGGFQWFYGSQKPPNPFFAPCKKDPLCHIEFFNNVSKYSQTSAISTTIKFVRGQNLFLSEKKRIREGKLTCPTSLVRPEPFCFTQKRIRSWEDQLSGGFIHHFEPIRALKILFYLGGKWFQCPGPGNKLTLYHWKKRIHSERAFWNASF